VIVLSDLCDDHDDLITGLRHFHHRRHDVVVFQVLDRAELEFPFADPTRFVGLEHAPTVQTDPRALRSAYRDEIQSHLAQIESGCRQRGIDYQRILSDEPLDRILFRYLAARMQRVR